MLLRRSKTSGKRRIFFIILCLVFLGKVWMPKMRLGAFVVILMLFKLRYVGVLQICNKSVRINKRW